MVAPFPVRRTDKLLLWGIAAAVVVPALVDLATSGAEAIFRYSAADAFYYHTVARNWARMGFASFDQSHATNGFHPLWQVLVAILYWLNDRLGLSELTYLRFSILACLALAAWGVKLVGSAALAAHGRLSPLFALLPVGAYAFIIAPFWVFAVDHLHVVNPYEGPLPLYGTVWSFVNGLETPLAIFAFGALAVAVVHGRDASLKAAIHIGAMCAFLTLARLDHVFIAAAVAASVAWKEQRRHALALGAAFLVPLLVYFAVNRWYAGSAFPVSGAAKSTFPRMAFYNLKDLFRLLVHPRLAALLLDRSFRMLQIVLPAIAVVAFAALRFRRFSDPWQRFLLACGAGALVLAAYNFWFVKVFAVGHWYFPISILLVTLYAMELPTRQIHWLPLVPLSMLVFVLLHRRVGYHSRFASFYLTEAPLLKTHYQHNPPKVMEFDDGIFAFGTGFPTFSGFGLTIDAEAYRAWKQGEMGRLALERGFDRAAMVVYADPKVEGIHASSSTAECTAFMNGFFKQLGKLPQHDLSVDYLSPSGEIAVLRFRARPSVP